MKWFQKSEPPAEAPRAKPSEEAIQARIAAHSITLRADRTFDEMLRLRETNHFGERIRRVYEGA